MEDMPAVLKAAEEVEAAAAAAAKASQTELPSPEKVILTPNQNPPLFPCTPPDTISGNIVCACGQLCSLTQTV